MSIDHTLEELQNFRDALERFVEVLRSGQAEQEQALAALGGQWDDAFRREFEAQHQELAAPVERFLRADAEQWLAFLDDKIMTARRYLHDV